LDAARFRTDLRALDAEKKKWQRVRESIRDRRPIQGAAAHFDRLLREATDGIQKRLAELEQVEVYTADSAALAELLKDVSPVLHASFRFSAVLGAGVALFRVLKALAARTFLLYGMVKDPNRTMPHVVLPQLMGRLVGRFYFLRKFGPKWRRYVAVVSAGFFCGAGLITVFRIGVMFLSKSIFKLPY